jgi:hypothetical protein
MLNFIRISNGKVLRSKHYKRWQKPGLFHILRVGKSFIPVPKAGANHMADTNLAAIHAKRITIQQKDMKFVAALMQSLSCFPVN